MKNAGKMLCFTLYFMLLTKWHSCIVPCLPWFEPGPFSNVLEACHIPLYIDYGSCRHVLEDCEVIESVRKSEGIRSFLDGCRDAGLSSGSSFRHYVSGLDAKGNAIPTKDHLARGGSLLRLTDEWLSTWEPQDWSVCDILHDTIHTVISHTLYNVNVRPHASPSRCGYFQIATVV